MNETIATRTGNVDKLLGRKLRTLRLSKHYTQEQMAHILGVTFQQIQKYEKGANRISAGRLFLVCEHFKISSAYFFEDPPWANDISQTERELSVVIALAQISPTLRSAIEQCISAAAKITKEAA